LSTNVAEAAPVLRREKMKEVLILGWSLAIAGSKRGLD
jgi:hypothetical protein